METRTPPQKYIVPLFFILDVLVLAIHCSCCFFLFAARICVQIYGFFSRYTNKNAVFALKYGILGCYARDFHCYMLRCGVGTSSTIVRLSYGYLSVILRIFLLFGDRNVKRNAFVPFYESCE